MLCSQYKLRLYSGHVQLLSFGDASRQRVENVGYGTLLSCIQQFSVTGTDNLTVRVLLRGLLICGNFQSCDCTCLHGTALAAAKTVLHGTDSPVYVLSHQPASRTRTIRNRFIYIILFWPVWLNGRAFARDPKGRGFEPRPVRFQVTAFGKLLTRMCLCHQAV